MALLINYFWEASLITQSDGSISEKHDCKWVAWDFPQWLVAMCAKETLGELQGLKSRPH